MATTTYLSTFATVSAAHCPRYPKYDQIVGVHKTRVPLVLGIILNLSMAILLKRKEKETITSK